MIDAPSLPDFCAEMRRLAAVIEARAELLPDCGGPDRGGLRIELEGGTFLLTYSEKGVTDVLARSADADAVMEQVFVQVTGRLAAEDLSSDAPAIEPQDFVLPSIDEARAAATQLQNDGGLMQLRLMAQLNAEWGRRQAERNVARALEIQHFFNGSRP
ncbi:MAG: hypothetical protein P0Y52_10575 [Candidatus Brevundimonas phytovorans]|nr:hypothetical protein [Brevundimonas sp.]WEK56987.1 MAG: hypothetical protein P0Y52_10575 [Brevundimonas sp.]